MGSGALATAVQPVNKTTEIDLSVHHHFTHNLRTVFRHGLETSVNSVQPTLGTHRVVRYQNGSSPG